jgi:hypothetical protein
VVLPEAAVALDPARGVPHRPGPETAPPHAALLGAREEPGPFEHAEMLVHARERHPERARELGDGGLASGEPGENGAPGRIGEGREDGVEVKRF